MAKVKQPRLRNEWGSEFFGRAQTAGHVWYYDKVQDDGSVRRYPLIPMKVEVDGQGQEDGSPAD